MGLPENSPLILADAHVHLYDCFDMEQLLNLTIGNFQREASHHGEGFPFKAFLFLAEKKNQNGFQRLYDQAQKGPSQSEKFGKWTFRPTKEDCSLYARLDEKRGLYIIAGYQINTLENLEVLALGTIRSFKEELSLKTLIPLISRAGALPVIPWGVGKWLGRRGSLLKDLLGEKNFPLFFMGDNRNRPFFWTKPNLLKKAEKTGWFILPGSDSLPFPEEIRYIGKFGFKFPGSVDPQYPGRDIKKMLLDPATRPQAYGSLENPVRFIWNQLRMSLIKR